MLKHESYGTYLMTMTNGWQWSSVPMSPELARLSIEVLQEYLKEEDIA